MKRVIKFRLWDDVCKNMLTEEDLYRKDILGVSVNGDFIMHHDGIPSDLFGDSGDYTSEESRDDIVLMQYTGLKDKNGVEIYEGDVVRIIGDYMWKHEGIYTVGYDRGSFNLTHQSLTMGMRTLLDLDFNLIEVLGNIHEGNFKDNR